MPARVLICRSNPLLSDPRVDKIARALARGGYEVQLLGWDKTGSLPLEEEQEGNRCYRCRIVVKEARGLGYIPYELRWQAALLQWLVKRHAEIDVIHACDFDTLLPSLIVKKVWGIRVVYDIFDFYADMLRLTPGLFKKLIRFLDIHAMDAADAVIIADDSRYEQIKGARPRRIEVIYNSPEDQKAVLEHQLVPSKDRADLQIAYVGNLQVERGLLELFAVLQKHPEWKLDLAGYGPDETEIIQAALELPNITWHGRIPYQRALELDYQADLLVATYSPAIPNHRFSSPNKLFEAMMLAKPVIVARNTNSDRIVDAEACGIVVDYGDIPALEAALLRLQREPSLRHKYGANARNAYERTYAWEKMHSRLLGLYQGLAH